MKMHLPCASLHSSKVQVNASTQVGGVPDLQPTAASHVSFPVQNLPSSQAASLGWCLQPRVLSHESIVQKNPSSHESGVPGTQSPLPPHVSTPLHTSPSSHWPLLLQGVPATQPPRPGLQNLPTGQSASLGVD